MAKVLNQLLYSSIVFGSELPSGVLRLESTSSGTKGAVEIVGTHVDIISGSTIGRLLHSNTGTRIYDFPDYAGQVLISGIFTDKNQLVYSSNAGVYAVLANSLSGALVTDALGDIEWATGIDGQVLTIVSGSPSFASLPDTGIINPSIDANQLAYYATAGNDLSPLTTVASRTLLSNSSGSLVWSLLEASYLKASGGTPLPNGNSTQLLSAVGDGTFVWVDKNNSVINTGTQYRVPYYSTSPTGTTLSESSFLQVEELYRALMLTNRGSIRFYEATANGSSFLELKAPTSLGPSVSWTLPATDGVPTLTHPALLSTDGAGNLSFVVVDHGTVNSGLLNQIAYYASSGNDVSGLTTISSRILGSPLGVPSWILITEGYLSTTGSVPLSSGVLNQVLVSDGSGNFKWETAVNITGEVLSGVVNRLAYYPATGTKVDDTSFLSVDNTLKIFNLLDGAKLRIFPTSSSNYIELQSPALSSSVSYYLPAVDGLSGYALVTNGSGVLSFEEVGRGVVNTGTPLTLAYYQAADNEVYPWTNVASRVALTTSANEILWGLVTAEYLSASGGVPLGVGSLNDVLSSDGLGSFVWTDISTIVGKVNPALASHLAYYAADGNQVSGSSWINNDELNTALELQNGGSLRFYDPTMTAYASLAAPSGLASNVFWYLPLADATSSGQALVSNALGQLSFADLVDVGVQDAVAVYQNGTARQVTPSANFYNTLAGLLLTGATFNIIGEESTTPTVVTISSGNNTSGVGANLYLSSGTGVNAGSVYIGAGSNDYFSVDDGGFVSILSNASMRFYDTALNYVGFKAPTTVPSSLVWVLPNADGSSGQLLSTDGLGNLSWVTNTINTGVLNTIPYYSGLNELSSSSLLIPAGLPSSIGHTLLVDNVTGQLSYEVLVEPLATVGEIAVYTDSQKVGYFSDFTYDDILKIFSLGSGGSIKLFETTNTNSTTLKASSDLTTSTTLTLPPDLPANDGYVLAGETDGKLLFREPNSDTRWEKRGSIVLEEGSRAVTVIYDTPFSTQPTWVNVQWVTDDQNNSYLPTYAVEKSTQEGFIVRFSTEVPVGTYNLNWQSYLTSVVSTSSYIFIVGGQNSGGYLNSISIIPFDTNTSIAIATAMSSSRAYTCCGSSATKGYIFGGSSSVPAPLNLITSYDFVSGVVTDLSATLTTARSGSASVGTRAKTYIAGGSDLLLDILSIESFDNQLETISTLPISLANPSVRKASATNHSLGAIANNSLTIELFNYVTEVLSSSTILFGGSDVSVGANDAVNNMGYFGRDTGSLSSYSFLTDTLTALPNSLNSSLGLSAAGNSLDHAYFAGDSIIDSLSFVTNSVVTVNTMLGTGHMSASSSTFQSKGLV